MTKAHILKQYFKKFYNLDIEGFTTTDVIKNYLKEKHNYSSNANSFISVISEMIDNELAPDGGGSGGGMMSRELC